MLMTQCFGEPLGKAFTLGMFMMRVLTITACSMDFLANFFGQHARISHKWKSLMQAWLAIPE